MVMGRFHRVVTMLDARRSFTRCSFVLALLWTYIHSHPGIR